MRPVPPPHPATARGQIADILGRWLVPSRVIDSDADTPFPD